MFSLCSYIIYQDAPHVSMYFGCAKTGSNKWGLTFPANIKSIADTIAHIHAPMNSCVVFENLKYSCAHRKLKHIAVCKPSPSFFFYGSSVFEIKAFHTLSKSQVTW